MIKEEYCVKLSLLRAALSLKGRKLLEKLGLCQLPSIYYIGSSQSLPPPLTPEEEKEYLAHYTGKEPEIRQALKKEAALVEQKLPKGGALIAMCIEGQEMSSVALSQKMQQLAARGASQLTFLIGSSFGLDEDLKKKADLRLSMSPMTFPHHLARVMLLEQIYRAYQIEAGTKYHK